MGNRWKKALKNQDGSAILYAIAILAVLVVFALALLLASYSLFSTANQEYLSLQSRELAQTLAACVQHELEVTAGADEIGTPAFTEKYPLWTEVYNSIRQDKWTFYDPAVYLHSREKAFRYYQLELDHLQNGLGQQYADELHRTTEVAMYWKLPVGAEDASVKDGATLVVSISCGLEEKRTTVTSYYELKVTEEKRLDGSDVEVWQWELTKRE